YGGEEFLVCLVECTPDEVASVAECIRRESVQATVSFRRKDVRFTLSGGAVFVRGKGPEAMKLVERADRFLYQAKREGKNRVVFQG
ncbi:MAG: diguanylate cyclase, partial [Candidatus Omnitrophica bacterium]|nr:diguanylate cyclase [Candidatus Omnitrophota bacterium]